MEAQSYPLSWPFGWPRTPSGKQARAKFSQMVTKTGYGGSTYRGADSLSIHQSVKRLRSELDRLNAVAVVVSTNIKTRADGMPLSESKRVDDPGVAVYFKRKGVSVVFACDKWDRPADNLAAVAKHIEALRGMDRWGVGSLDQAFAGYAALPAPSTKRPWREVMGFSAQETVHSLGVSARYATLAKQRHPDAGGSQDLMAELNQARDDARKEIGA